MEYPASQANIVCPSRSIARLNCHTYRDDDFLSSCSVTAIQSALDGSGNKDTLPPVCGHFSFGCGARIDDDGGRGTPDT